MTQDFYQQGLAKAKAGDRYGAIQLLSVAIQSSPQSIPALADAYYQRGLVLFDLGDRQGAIADYNEAIKLNPEAIDVYIARSITNLAISDVNSAQTDIAQALAINSQSAIAHQLLGLTYKLQNQVEKAIAA